jgi:hypothetical protein
MFLKNKNQPPGGFHPEQSIWMEPPGGLFTEGLNMPLGSTTADENRTQIYDHRSGRFFFLFFALFAPLRLIYL